MKELEDIELMAELPDVRILDDYEEVLPGAKDRLLDLRRLAGNWDELGIAHYARVRQVERELRHEM